MTSFQHRNTHRRLLGDSSPPPQYQYSLQERTLSVSIAALVVLTILYLVIDSVLKCHRRSHRSSHHEHTSTTFDRSHSSHIPTMIYGAPPSSPSCSSTNFESECCVICLGAFVFGESIRVLPRCKHVFHKDCIDQWMPVRSLDCPVCRVRSIEEAGEPNCRNGGDDGNGNRSALFVINFGNNYHTPTYL